MGRRLPAIVVAALIWGGGAVAWSGEPAVAPAVAPAVEAEGADEEGEEGKAAKKPSAFKTYLVNRLKDFADIFSMHLMLSDSLSARAHIRVTRLAQVGFGRFSGTKVGFDGPCAGIYGEGRTEIGLSVFYWAWIGRKTSPEGITQEAAKRNWFFGRVDDIKAEPTYREFYDGNRPWHTVGFAACLPFLPGIEAQVNPAEAVDFVLSLFAIPGVRVPPPFYKTEVTGEKVPAPNSIRWHGQERFERYD